MTMKVIDSAENCQGVTKLFDTFLLSYPDFTILNGVKLPFNNLYSNLIKKDGVLYFYSNSSLYKIVENTIEVVCSFEGYKSIKPLSDSLFLCHKRLSNSELYYSVLDKDSSLLWEDVGDSFIDVLGDKLYVRNKLVFNYFSIRDFLNIELWHFTLPEGFTLYKQIQLVGNVLFFNAFKGVNNFHNVYGLDIETGKIIWEQNFQVPYKKCNIAFLINPANNLSYGYGGSLYQVFDPVNGKMVLEKDMSAYYNKGIMPDLHRQSISDGKLWFVSGRGESVKFGALNIETSEIEFIQDFPLELDEQLDTPIFHQGRLYLRGLYYNKLWILE